MALLRKHRAGGLLAILCYKTWHYSHIFIHRTKCEMGVMLERRFERYCASITETLGHAPARQ